MRVTIIIPISQVDECNQIALQFDPNGGDETFGKVTLSASGNLPATHSICSSVASQEFIDSIQSLSAQVPTAAYYLGDDPLVWIDIRGLRFINDE